MQNGGTAPPEATSSGHRHRVTRPAPGRILCNMAAAWAVRPAGTNEADQNDLKGSLRNQVPVEAGFRGRAGCALVTGHPRARKPVRPLAGWNRRQGRGSRGSTGQRRQLPENEPEKVAKPETAKSRGKDSRSPSIIFSVQFSTKFSRKMCRAAVKGLRRRTCP